VYVCQLRLVAANSAYTGDIGGLSGADYVCYRQSRQAGLRSTFRAFIAGRVQDLQSIIHRHRDRNIPIVNAKVTHEQCAETNKLNNNKNNNNTFVERHMVVFVVQRFGVGLMIARSLVRLPAGALSSHLGQLSLPSLRGR